MRGYEWGKRERVLVKDGADVGGDDGFTILRWASMGKNCRMRRHD